MQQTRLAEKIFEWFEHLNTFQKNKKILKILVYLVIKIKNHFLN